MSDTKMWTYVLAVIVVCILTGFWIGFLFPRSKTESVSNYLRYQDDKIASKSAEIVFWKEVADQWEEFYFEENKIRVDMQNYLTDEERYAVLNK